MIRLPDKLPDVTGRGGTAVGFRLAFEAINRLSDYCRSLTPSKSQNVLTNHTSIGVTRKANPASETTSTDDGAVWL